MSQLSEYDGFSAIFGLDFGSQSILLFSSWSSSLFFPGNRTNVFVNGCRVLVEVNDETVCIEWNKSTASISDGHCRVFFILESTKQNSILTREKGFVVEKSNQNVVAAITLAFVSVRRW